MATNIYQEAIADAKAVRASALANAKAAIQEAFEPKVKAMLKKSMEESEEEELDETEEMDERKHSKKEEDELDEAEGASEYDESTPNELDEAEEEDELDETTLDEILAELEGEDEPSDDEVKSTKVPKAWSPEDEDDEELDESEDELDEAKEEEDELDEAKEEDEEEEGEEEEGEEHAGTETKVVDITLGDLVDAIKAAMAGEHGGEEAGDSEDISLDEILAEMEDENKEEEEDELDERKRMEEAKRKAKKDMEPKKGTKGAALKATEKETAYKELQEAKKAISSMKEELNEINLLNAKLLYVNKIFKSKTLTESQKVKVLNAFDRATTVKETKNVYNTLIEALQTTKKTSLKESMGFASKAAGMSPNRNTVESDPFVTRMQKLAGII